MFFKKTIDFIFNLFTLFIKCSSRYNADVTSCDKRFFISYGLSSDKRNKIAAAYVAK